MSTVRIFAQFAIRFRARLLFEFDVALIYFFQLTIK